MTTETAKFTATQRQMYDLSRAMGLSERAAVEAARAYGDDDNVPAGYAPADVRLWSQRTAPAGNDQLAVLEAALAECNRLLAQIERDRGHSAIADRITGRVKDAVAAYEHERNRTRGTRGTPQGAPLREIAPAGNVGAGDTVLNETGTIVDYAAEADEILGQWRKEYTGPSV